LASSRGNHADWVVKKTWLRMALCQKKKEENKEKSEREEERLNQAPGTSDQRRTVRRSKAFRKGVVGHDGRKRERYVVQ